MGVVDVPDERLQKLYDLILSETSPQEKEKPTFSQPKIIPAFIKFYDIAGLVKGASEGEGLGNQFLAHIRETDAILQVVRGFSDENVIRAGAVDPQSDIELINAELALSDLQTVEKRLESRKFKEEHAFLSKVKAALEQGRGARDVVPSDDEQLILKEMGLLTAKPVLYVLNVDESELAESNVITKVGEYELIKISAKVEADLISFSEEERVEYLKEVGIKEPGLNLVIRKCYDLLGLQTYLTAGPKEVRAWTIKKDYKAPEAAGVIHTDFQRGFIKAEIIDFETLIKVGGWKKAKELGKLRMEGKEYVMQDGDVVEFRFNV